VTTSGSGNVQDRDRIVERLYRMVRRWTENSGYRLNPEAEVVEGIVQALARSTMTHGVPYCPCREITGDAKADRANICPCVHHHAEIAQDNHCRCVLFVGQNYDPSQAYDVQGDVSHGNATRSLRKREVSVYTTSWCYHSRRVRSLLDGQSIAYVNIDIEQDARIARQLEAWNDGNRSVPTIVARMILTEPRSSELEQVLLTPGVALIECTVYVTRWCGQSRRTRAWFDAQGIPAKFIDIEQDDEATQQVEMWNGGNRSVPTLDLMIRLVEPSDTQLLRALGETI